MKDFSKKIAFILPTFLAIAVGSVVGLLLIRWLFSIQFQWLDLSTEVWDIFIPLLFPWIPMLIWLRSKLRSLQFKGSNSNGRMLFMVISWLTITATMIFSQQYLVSSTAKLLTLESVDQIIPSRKNEYYKIEKFYVDVGLAANISDFEVSGKHNENFNMNIYFVAPIINYETEEYNEPPKVWYGVNFHKRISNRLSPEEKENAFRTYFQECTSIMNNTDIYDLEYFKPIPKSKDKANFLAAVEVRLNQPTDENYVILSPIHEKFEERIGNKHLWSFLAFFLGTSIFTLVLLWPKFNYREVVRLRNKKYEKQESLFDGWEFLIPKGGHFVTSIIIDLNIIVFVIMVFSGVSFISASPMDLLEWGGNNKYQILQGEWWRLLTNIFLHSGIIHLVFNIFALVLAGIFIEPVLGRKQYTILYLLSGIFASFVSTVWHSNTVSVGASGAIFGLYGALFVLLIFTDVFPKQNQRTLIASIGSVIGINLIYGILTPQIDNAAHIGGLLSGAVIGYSTYYINKLLNS
jgi:rhomboid protease GluP